MKIIRHTGWQRPRNKDGKYKQYICRSTKGKLYWFTLFITEIELSTLSFGQMKQFLKNEIEMGVVDCIRQKKTK